MITRQHILDWLEQSADVLQDKKAHLTDLDSPIGDADHGINMSRGFKKVVEKLPSVADTDIGNILKTSGMALISSVGGASGPLYGTFFMRAGGALQSKEVLDSEDLLQLITAGVEGLVQRGRAQAGEKTMLDALIPALDAMRERTEAGDNVQAVLEAGVAAAEQGVKDTVPMIAKKGRASYLGERSIGHQDPGATSSYYLLATLRDVVKADQTS
jgi:phosphoenolpyruvate---glycerone phosphotransferase subunit DhaL